MVQETHQQPQQETGWLATLGKALREHAALLAALIALVGVIITQVATTQDTQEGLAEQRNLEEERAQEAELQTYLDDMGQMLLDKDNPLAGAAVNSVQSSLARAKTLTMLERLDAQRKRNILRFLYESHLIQKGEPVVSLRDPNLTRANLQDAHLSKADLSRADLSDADLADVNLQVGILQEADLTDTDLTRADLSRADLRNIWRVIPGVLNDVPSSLRDATMPSGSKHD